jgi:hypothetical protein
LVQTRVDIARFVSRSEAGRGFHSRPAPAFAIGRGSPAPDAESARVACHGGPGA